MKKTDLLPKGSLRRFNAVQQLNSSASRTTHRRGVEACAGIQSEDHARRERQRESRIDLAVGGSPSDTRPINARLGLWVLGPKENSKVERQRASE